MGGAGALGTVIGASLSLISFRNEIVLGEKENLECWSAELMLLVVLVLEMLDRAKSRTSVEHSMR